MIKGPAKSIRLIRIIFNYELCKATPAGNEQVPFCEMLSHKIVYHLVFDTAAFSWVLLHHI